MWGLGYGFRVYELESRLLKRGYIRHYVGKYYGAYSGDSEF